MSTDTKTKYAANGWYMIDPEDAYIVGPQKTLRWHGAVTKCIEGWWVDEMDRIVAKGSALLLAGLIPANSDKVGHFDYEEHASL